MKNTLLVSTRKGLLILERKNNTWQVIRDAFEGIPVSLSFVDGRTGTWWAGLDHGHWGIKLHRSDDRGLNWIEVEAPKYPDGAVIKEGQPASLKYIWAFAHGSEKQPGRLYIGTEPGGLFYSDDDGASFDLVNGLWNHPSRESQWMGGGRDNAGIHSIIVDPKDQNHIFVGISVAGVFETRDGGQSWIAKNRGLRADYLPDPDAEIGHDPHLLVAHPENIDILWQQNHCGIFRSTDGGSNWNDISDPNGPAGFGFAIAIDERSEERAWVVPGVSDEIRIAVDKALCVCRTDDGGKTWKAFRKGLPQSHCYDIVYRHALVAQGDDLLFGTTTGNLFHSHDGGESWSPVSHHFPMVYALYLTD